MGTPPSLQPGFWALRAVAGVWTTTGFSGRAWSEDARVGVAAPAYADAIIVSGPVEVINRLTNSELEALRVARHMPIPDMAD